MDITKQPQTILSMCTGIRGLERGLERAGIPIRPIVYLEIEAIMCANLVAGMEAGLLAPAPIFTDITKFDGRPFRGKVCGIVAGYSCTTESLAGLREGHKDQRFIWPSIRRIIAATGPLWCFFENVDDHLTGTFPIIQRSLRNMGYAVEAGIFTAEEAGAPHERGRLFILAIASRELLNWRREKGGWWEQYTNGSSELEYPGSFRYEQEHAVSAGGNGIIPAGEKLADTDGDRSGRGPAKTCEAGREDEKAQQRQEGNEAVGQRGGPIAGDGGQGNGLSPGSVAHTNSSHSESGDEPTGREKRSNTDRGGKKSKLAHAPGKRKREQADPAANAIATGGGARHESGNGGELAHADVEGLQKRGDSAGVEKFPSAERSGSKGAKEMADPNVWGPQPGQHARVGRKRQLDVWPAPPGQPQHPWEHARTITRDAQPSLGLSVARYNFREDILRALGNSVVEQQAELAFRFLMKKHFGK